MNKSVNTVLNMLSFQYKPFEKRLLNDLKKAGHDDFIQKYMKSSKIEKIKMLNWFVRNLGL